MLFRSRSEIALPVPDILSVCKAEEGDDAVASLTNDNAADGKIDGAESAVPDRMDSMISGFLDIVKR